MLKVSLAVLSLLLLGCGQETATVGPNDPEFNWMNNPENGNLRVSRYGTDFLIGWTDPKTGVQAIHTTIPIEPAPGEAPSYCGPQEALGFLERQDVGLPDFNDFYRSWLRSHAKGEVWIIILDTNAPGDCLGFAVIAEGRGTLHYTDNDAFAWYPLEGSIRRNDNSFGYMARGKLTTVTGEELRYSGHVRIIWDPQAGPSGSGKRIEHAQVRIH